MWGDELYAAGIHPSKLFLSVLLMNKGVSQVSLKAFKYSCIEVGKGESKDKY